MTLFKNYKSSLRSVLSFFAISASLTFVSCQDEDFGYDQSEIRQAFLNRKYVEEFKKQFPNADPNHTWMCDPDTFGIESLVGTRAYPAGMTPSVTKLTTTKEATISEIKSALDFLPEGIDNRGKVTQSFDYYAAEDNGSSNTDSWAEYIITPTFWGRKFCGTNTVGIYWFDNGGNIHQEDTYKFWHDFNNGNGDDCGIYVKYEKTETPQLLQGSDHQIDHEHTWTNSRHDYPLGIPCTECGVELHSGTSYITYNDKNGGNRTVQLVEQKNWNCIRLESSNQINNDWDTQLQVKNPYRSWNAGEKIHFKMEYITSWKTPFNNAIDYQLYSNGAFKAQISTTQQLQPTGTGNEDWKTFEFDVTIPDNVSSINQININLNPGKEGKDNILWIKNVSWKKNSCSKCGGKGYLAVEKFILPQFRVKIPVGMKWGIFFDTKKQQGIEEYTRYYSNANLNHKKVTFDREDYEGDVYTAATYSNNGVTYCCFEDAAVNLHGGGYVGRCDCGYGHYDTDFNDFVFSIEGSPVISSYQAVKYRIMCEDLGGTYDWDFNDIVYDVEYADSPTGTGNATVKVTLQAVGGTFPVYMQFDSQFNSGDNFINRCEIYNNTNQRIDLHGALYNQQKDNKSLYLPVNVERDGAQNTITNQGSRLVCTYYLNAAKYSNLDARRFVELIHILVEQKTKDGTSTYSTVQFPTNKGNSSLTPECFMTSVNAPWTREHQNVVEKFPGFAKWVEDNKSNSKWWDAGIGM